ncbi:hypothetical protein MIND_00174300 [Mycena indigotica]|uniref:Uncharacterized protein n=1 Tax=Mycena indigotica TaxID=2126181 RepID=A0A8H6TCZ6_9AGAR|nr:uncharacterized protein MIND_00174300 [Mycena indigotica]KAF7316550.1 hypothetical protein MIND_00174300 [Mycena indigotica]
MERSLTSSYSSSLKKGCSLSYSMTVADSYLVLLMQPTPCVFVPQSSECEIEVGKHRKLNDMEPTRSLRGSFAEVVILIVMSTATHVYICVFCARQVFYTCPVNSSNDNLAYSLFEVADALPLTGSGCYMMVQETPTSVLSTLLSSPLAIRTLFRPEVTRAVFHSTSFRGTGPPSSDFGHPGDVYVDLNPRLYALYWRERRPHTHRAGSWTRWTGILLDQVPLYRFLTPHPWVQNPEECDIYLWVDPGGITWTTKDALCASRAKMIEKGIAAVDSTTMPDVHALVSEVLHRMISAEQKPLVQRSLTPVINNRNPDHKSPLIGNSSRRGSISLVNSHSTSVVQNQRRSSIHLPFRPTSNNGPRSPSIPSNPLSSPLVSPQGHEVSSTSEYSPRPAANVSPYSSPVNASPRQHTPEMKALNDMRRAQEAELKSKHELKSKNRELSKLRQKEKDVISMSYHYQKRERELTIALEEAEQRSSAELEELREVLARLQRQADSSRQERQTAVSQVQRTQDELAEIQREIARLQARTVLTRPT